MSCPRPADSAEKGNRPGPASFFASRQGFRFRMPAPEENVPGALQGTRANISHPGSP